jgi:two-component system, OmpR family, sensor histidine kinase TctE
VSRSGHAHPSLSRRLLWVLVSTLSVIAVALGAGGTLLIERVVDESFDKLLGASVAEIAETVSPERGHITLDIPPAALGMLEDVERDNVYYSVRQGNRLLTGYADLPTPRLRGVGPRAMSFRFALFRGQHVRIGAEARQLPGIETPVVIEVARTTGGRSDLVLVMLGALYLLEAILVVFAGLLIWPGLKWSLRPVERIRAELETKPADHANFAPLELQHAPSELVGLVDGFNHLLKRLEDAVAGMRQFTADASHQMRTPLAILKTHLALLSQHITPSAAGSSSLADIRSAVTRLEALLTRLTALARADEAARGGIERSSIDLRAVIAQVIADFVPLAAQRDITLSVDAPERPVRIHAEPIIAAEILENLVDNAIRYNRRGGTVCISVHEAEETVTVSVEDDGPGIPEAERKHVFDRFYRLQRDQAQPGSGLGLSIVRTLGEALHARVSIDTASSGQGLKVSVQFEVGRLEPAAAGAADERRRAVPLQ